MIDNVMEVLGKECSDYLQRCFKSVGMLVSMTKYVELIPVVTQQGEIFVPSGCLGLSLVNMAVDDSKLRYISREEIPHTKEGVKLYLTIMLNAGVQAPHGSGNESSKDYTDALKLLSAGARFFYRKRMFNRSNAPGLGANIEKLVVEPLSLSFEDQNHLWSSLGAKYMPSVIYKVTVETIREASFK